MNYNLKPSKLFLKQIEKLSSKAKSTLKDKLILTKQNPSRNKRIQGHKLFVFRIRIQNNNEELRIIYLLDKQEIKLLSILDRKKNYSELEKYLKLLKKQEQIND